MDKQINKNALCPCGSGMKYKKCCMNKKSRHESISVDMGTPTVINGLTIGPKGKIEFKTNGIKAHPLRALLRKWYDRSKGPKILYDISIDPNDLTLDYLNQFDYIYAIDTNSKEVNGDLISVCYCVKYKPSTRELLMRGPICFKNNPDVTEKTNWRELIKDIIHQKEYRDNFKIAIIVDSDYGNIEKYNSRESPIDTQFFLPENFTLIYASTDSGLENFPNRLIAECDKLAKKYIKDLER